MILSKYLNGIGGTVHGSFFRVADEVDTSKPPGSTSLDRLGYPATFGEALQGIATGQDFVYSPNLTWFLLACGVWWIAPYQLQQDSLQEICKQRLIVNHGMVFGYVGFWHVACYWRQWAKRPFAENRPYSPRKVIHNIFYTWLGILQWTLTEVAILYCYQTNRIPYLEHPPSMVQTAVASLLVPAFRDVHFYFTHRFLHTSFMYKYIHSVHHRNTADIEPFSGLCMHPVEHLYYFTCYAPCLWLRVSPFILFWMGLHTILSPAASHSGFEDHFSSDLFHYLHHRYSDCNYGGAPLLDRWFGTYRDQLKGGNTKTIPNDHKASLGFLPEHAMFQCSCLGLVVLAGWCYDYESSMNHPYVMAFLLSTGPCWIALGLYLVNHRKHQSFLAAIFGKKDGPASLSLVFHTVMGILFGILPATYLMALVLSSPPQQS